MGIASVGGHIILKIRSPLDVGDSQSEAASVGGLFHFRPSVQCRLLMLWTAPPPARECHECGCC
jgi:hypothetical protein